MKNTEKLAKENNRDYALRVIRENIINLELKPGSMISEQDIAEELHLSRTPVHEALQELARTKIIEIMPQKGSLVSLVDMKRVDEAVFMRATIESAVAEEASKLVNDSDIAQMEANIKLQKFYHETKDVEKLLEADNQFHELLYKITNKMQWCAMRYITSSRPMIPVMNGSTTYSVSASALQSLLTPLLCAMMFMQFV